MTGALAASVGLIPIGSTTVTAYIILASGRVEILITDSVFKRYSVPSILDKHKGIQWLQFVNRYSPPASNSLGTRPSINQKKGCGKRAGWKYEPSKACRDFSAEPDTRTNVLSRMVFTAFHNEAKCQHGDVDPRPSTVQVFYLLHGCHILSLYMSIALLRRRLILRSLLATNTGQAPMENIKRTKHIELEGIALKGCQNIESDKM